MARGNLVHSGIHFARHMSKRAVRFAEPHDLIKFEDDAIVAGRMCVIVFYDEIDDDKTMTMILLLMMMTLMMMMIIMS